MPFIALGIPGALASMDVVHFHWDRCPYSLQNLFTGKEGYPTVAVQMACTHDGRFVHSTTAVYGVQVKPGDDFSRLGKLAFSRYIHQIRGPMPTSVLPVMATSVALSNCNVRLRS